MNDIRTINISRKNMLTKQTPSLFGRFLPFILILSFMIANFYNAMNVLPAEIPAIYMQNSVTFYILYLAMISTIDYFILKVVLWLYRTILSFRPYFYLVNTQTFNEHFKFWYAIKNIIYGLISCILFAAPYLHVYLPIVGLILQFLVILLTYVTLKKHVDIMFRHMYFKLLMYPLFIFEALSIILTIITGGY